MVDIVLQYSRLLSLIHNHRHHSFICMKWIDHGCSPLSVGMLSNDVIVMMCHYRVFRQCVTIKFAWSMFYGNLELHDRIRQDSDYQGTTLCVKYGLMSLPLFDVSQVDFMS